jgi:hypothetical protein
MQNHEWWLDDRLPLHGSQFAPQSVDLGFSKPIDITDKSPVLSAPTPPRQQRPDKLPVKSAPPAQQQQQQGSIWICEQCLHTNSDNQCEHMLAIYYCAKCCYLRRAFWACFECGHQQIFTHIQMKLFAQLRRKQDPESVLLVICDRCYCAIDSLTALFWYETHDEEPSRRKSSLPLRQKRRANVLLDAQEESCDNTGKRKKVAKELLSSDEILWATRRGDLNTLRQHFTEAVDQSTCLEQLGNIRSSDDDDQQPLLIVAALAGHVDIVKFYLQLGADPYQMDAKGQWVRDYYRQLSPEVLSVVPHADDWLRERRRRLKVAFLMGLHKRLGSTSPLRKTLASSSLFDRLVIGVIFEHWFDEQHFHFDTATADVAAAECSAEDS